MNAIIKAWVEALESGDYPQGRDHLEKDGKFCCLGVLCRIYDRMRPGELTIRHENGLVSFDGSLDVLPRKVVDDLGIDKSGLLCNSVIFEGSSYGTLIGLNDDCMPFSEIAQVIRLGGVKGIDKEQEST